MENQYNGKTKFIVVTGGVILGLGKGVAAASIGALLSNRLKVIPVKCDGYLNTDPGTMNPTEHGEVYVLDDGGEVDMDFGHYERFLNVVARSEWSLTMGKVFNPREKDRFYIISPDEDFETYFGRKADKRRKLYNGMIKCQVYMYFK